MSIAGLDVGSTGCKAVAFDLNTGQRIARAYQEYPLLNPEPGKLELDADNLTQAIRSVLAELASQTASDPVQSLACSVLGETVMAVDDQGKPLCNMIMNFDNRGDEEAAQLRDSTDAEEIFNITGHAINSYHSVFKIMYLRNHQKDIYSRAARFVTGGAYVATILGLPAAMDESMAARTMLFDIHRRQWSDRMIELTGVDADKLPRVVRPGEKIATLGANDFGLPEDCVFAGGLHDQPAGMVGSGVQSGEAALSTGTVACLGVRAEGSPDPQVMIRNNFPYYPTYGRNQFVSLAFNFTGGSLLKWFRDHLAVDICAEAERKGVDPYDLIMDDMSDEPTNLLVLPYFATSGTPYFDTQARGVMIGMATNTTRSQIAQALVEGVCYEIAFNKRLLGRAGIDVRRIRAVGGGARSDRWMQMYADILNTPVVKLTNEEGGGLGAAMLGAHAAGLVDSVEQAIDKFVKIDRTFEPDNARSQAYQRRMELYEQLYPTVSDLTHRLVNVDQ